jgi:hypothetical protein
VRLSTLVAAGLRAQARAASAVLLGVLAVGCSAGQPSSAIPYTEDFSDCEKWIEEETDRWSFKCEDGHYHFVAKEPRRSDSAVTALSEPVGRISISADADLSAAEGLGAIGLGCWHGRDEDSNGYRIVVGPEGWNILKEDADAGSASTLPAEESGLEFPDVTSDVLHLRADCVTGAKETTLKVYVNETLLGTSHDAGEGVGGFDQVGLIVTADTPPVAVDFDNFHVEPTSPISATETSTTAAAATEPPSHVVYRENFTRHSGAWPSHESQPGYDVGYADGAFEIALTQPYNEYQLPQHIPLTNHVQVAADVRNEARVRDQSGEQGVGCGYGENDGYFFLLSPALGAVVIRRQDESYEEPLVDSLTHYTVNKPPEPNHLVALCSAGEDGRTRLELWVNGRHVLTGEDPDGVPRFDRFSILAGNGTDPMAARFDNLTVRSSAE